MMNPNSINEPAPSGHEEDDQRWAEVGRLTVPLLHDLKNHIGGLKLFAGYLKKKFSDQPEVVEVSDRILGGLQRVTDDAALIGQLVRPLATQNVSLPELLHQVIQELAPQAAERKIQLILAESGDVSVEVLADPALLRRALTSLLKQLMALISPGEIAEARLHRAGNQCMIDLHHREAALQDRSVWEGLTRRNPAERLSLELLIARHIVEIHRGLIESEVASGAVLSVRLPVAEKT